MTDPRFLLVDDEPAVRRALSKVIGAYGGVVGAGTVTEALALVSDGRPWSAFFIDVGLPDGSGLEVLARARAGHAQTPAMVLTGWTTPEIVNATLDLRARFALKPIVSDRVHRFLDEATSLRSRVGVAVAGWVKAYGLSAAEADLLQRAALGEGRTAIAEARGSSEQTVKKQAATLLGRTGDASLQAAVGRLLREVAMIY